MIYLISSKLLIQGIQEMNIDETIDNKFFDKNIHFLSGDVTTDSMEKIIRWILYHNLETTKKELTLYINSDGGTLVDAFGVIDLMQASIHDFKTVSVGSSMSAAFYILISGTNGKRYAGKNSSLMCHQFSAALDSTKHHETKAWVKENDSLTHRTNNILTNAGLDKALLKKFLSPTDFYLTSEQAKSYGVIDNIL